MLAAGLVWLARGAAADQDLVLGFHGLGACNEIRQRIEDFCEAERMRVTNTFFPQSVACKASLYHPGTRNETLSSLTP